MSLSPDINGWKLVEHGDSTNIFGDKHKVFMITKEVAEAGAEDPTAMVTPDAFGEVETGSWAYTVDLDYLFQTDIEGNWVRITKITQEA